MEIFSTTNGNLLKQRYETVYVWQKHKCNLGAFMSGINASSMYLCQTWMHVLPNFPITEVFWYGLVHRNPADSSNAS